MCGSRGEPHKPQVWSLTKAAQFRAAMRNGRRLSAGPVRVFVNPNGLNFARLGSTLSRKQLPRAVDRNRAKRLLRESVRRHGGALQGLDIVFSASKAINEKSNREILALLDQIWAKLMGNDAAVAWTSSSIKCLNRN